MEKLLLGEKSARRKRGQGDQGEGHGSAVAVGALANDVGGNGGTGEVRNEARRSTYSRPYDSPFVYKIHRSSQSGYFER